jgi:hypothetical protein
MPDIDLACVQLYALVLYPHLIHSAYGASLSPALTDSLITSGVDMFLTHHHYQPSSTSGEANKPRNAKTTARRRAKL